MTRIAHTFKNLAQAQRRALIIYLTAGDPDDETSLQAARAAIGAGADILEVGVPFSDPVADGPVIQRAMGRALESGGGFDAALRLIQQVRKESDVPIVLFGYVNPLIAQGLPTAFARAKAAGVDGVLVVDVPHEESAPFRSAARQHSLDWIPLVAPTTSDARATDIAREASGFIYLVSMTGVTGGSLASLDRIRPILTTLRQNTDLPLCIGFGVRDGDSAANAATHADGVVAGSVVVEALEQGVKGSGTDLVAYCVGVLRAGVDSVGGESTS